MRKSKWPDFLFTITVRFICGIVIGGLTGLVFSWRGVLRSFSHDNTHVPLIWLGLCGLAGGIVAVFTVARWQTPWYKREPLNLRAELRSRRQDGDRRGSNVVKQSVRIKTIGEDGEQHQYSSMEELPPEVRSEIEALEKEAAQQPGKELTITETSQAGNAMASKIIHRKSVSVYKIVDDSGEARTYHSLDEMPREIREAIAEAKDCSK